jgi:transposase
MGTKERIFSPLPHDVSLEELVPKGDFYRRLQAALDLSFVRELVAPLYAGGGRPSVDPVVFFKLELVLFFEGLRSERRLMVGVVADRLSLRWYVGYDLHECLPDHYSSLTKIRERYGLEAFRRFFEEIVRRCIDAGLVRGEELFFDSTKVEADATVDSLAPRWAVEAHLGNLFDAGQRDDAADTSPPPPPPPPPPPQPEAPGAELLPTAGDEDLAEANASGSDWIARNGGQDRTFKSGPRERTSDSRASKTDPDASPMTWTAGSRLGYRAHYVVDGGKARVILGVLVTPSEVTENRPMLDLLWRTTFRWRLRPHHVTGDAKYGTRENIAAVEGAGVRAYVALPNFDFRDTGFYGPGHFSYDPNLDVYVCPDDKTLGRRARTNSARGTMYRAKAEVCNTCEPKKRCTDSDNGRTIYRHRDEDYYDRVRAYRGTFPYEKALRKRQVWIEPLFGEAKECHEMRRFRLRRLGRVNAEALLIASGQNIKRLVEFGGRKPEAPAQVAALRPPDTTQQGIHRSRRHRATRLSRPTR